MLQALALTLASLSPAPLPTIPAEPAPIVVQDDEKKKEPRDTSVLNVDKKKLALSGYDPVAYFKEGGGKPKKGDKKITHTHDGVTYRFASKANLELFKKDPTKYEPMYGGWCAYAMANGDKVEVNPEYFIVTDEGLFVFYKSFLTNTRKKWNKEGPAKLKPKADKNWEKFVKEAAEKRKKKNG